MRAARVIWAAALVAALVGTVAAQVKRVAVVETEMDAQSGASAKLNKAEVRQITAALRREAVNNLPQDRYYIMTTETVMAQGSAKLEECADENCVITLGAKIGADYIVRGTVSKLGPKLTVTVEMYETDDGNLVASSDLAASDNAAGLLEKAATACAEMYKKFDSKRSAAQKPPVTHTNAAAPTPTYQPPAPTPTPPPTYQPSVPTPTSTTTPTYTPTPTNQQSSGSGQVGAVRATEVIERSRNVPGRPSFSTLTDERDGRAYKTVAIGGKRWMAENLNYKNGKSWCYKNDDSNCGKYGRLYDWNTAKTVCPSRWHLPSRQEWDNLVTTAGGSKAAAGKKLKAASFNGADDFGFSALPGGYYYAGTFNYAGNSGNWWTATEFGGSGAYYRDMGYYNDGVDEDYRGKGSGFSVRCVQD